MIKLTELNNKVYLRGTIMNSVRQKFDKELGEQIVYFVLMVDRTAYKLPHNKDDYDYFYCFLSERLMSGVLLDSFRENVKMYDEIEIKGFLDNRTNLTKKVMAREVNYRALNSYISTICVLDYKKISVTDKIEHNNKNLLINKVRKDFGKDVNIEVTDNAMNKDLFGLTEPDLPNF